jgi:hypothetical protein
MEKLQPYNQALVLLFYSINQALPTGHGESLPFCSVNFSDSVESVLDLSIKL